VNVKPLFPRSINTRNKATVDHCELFHLLIGVLDDCYLELWTRRHTQDLRIAHAGLGCLTLYGNHTQVKLLRRLIHAGREMGSLRQWGGEAVWGTWSLGMGTG
jgi:hypothetical protein